jgi:signal transduction histidine kinase
LLEHELNNPGLREYTQVIIKEADRLQDLMQRLLSPHRPMLPGPVNIHEILERVRSLLKAEFPGIAAIVPRLRHQPAGTDRRSRATDPGGAQHCAQCGAGDHEPPDESEGVGQIVLRTRGCAR